MALKIIKNKKAFFFTMMAIVLLSLFLISYGIYYSLDSEKTINKRIKTMNSFVYSVEDDIPRQIYISGFRIIFLFIDEITNTGQYIINLNQTFEEAFFNKTIYGKEQELMNGVNFQGISDSLNQKAEKINANITLENPEIKIMQTDPWNIKIIFTSDLLINDKKNLAYWDRTYTQEVYIPITGFTDPFYIINTNGLVNNEINKTPYTTFVSGTDVTNLNLHSKNSYYKESASAPNFLNRLEGKTDADENGIESLVYLPELPQFAVKQKTVVDYIYFSSNSPAYHNIEGMPTWFRLDDEHLDDYQVEGLII